jgi:hypothetical protein
VAPARMFNKWSSNLLLFFDWLLANYFLSKFHQFYVSATFAIGRFWRLISDCLDCEQRKQLRPALPIYHKRILL